MHLAAGTKFDRCPYDSQHCEHEQYAIKNRAWMALRRLLPFRPDMAKANGRHVQYGHFSPFNGLSVLSLLITMIGPLDRRFRISGIPGG